MEPLGYIDQCLTNISMLVGNLCLSKVVVNEVGVIYSVVIDKTTVYM